MSSNTPIDVLVRFMDFGARCGGCGEWFSCGAAYLLEVIFGKRTFKRDLLDSGVYCWFFSGI